MVVDNDEPLVWIDGTLIPVSEASVSAFDHGVVVGDGAFETLQVLRHNPFAVTRHIGRLFTTLAALAIAPPDESVLRSALHDVCAANALEAGKVRLTVTAGAGPLGSGEPHGPARIIAAAEAAGEPPTPQAVTAPWTRNESGALAGLKTTSYAENVRALRYAHERGASEALFANTRGELCEGTGTNVFVAVDGILLTPPLASGCLAGVTRELLLELIDVREATLPLEVLASADEIFLTSSTRNVQALTAVDDRLLGPPGPLTAAATTAFADLLHTNLDP